MSKIIDKELPEEFSEVVYDFVETVREKGGKIKKGVNETTKALERGFAKLVIVAEDVDPIEIVLHLPALAKEKNVPLIPVKSKETLGKAAGIDVKASSIAIIDFGRAEKEFKELMAKYEELIKG